MIKVLNSEEKISALFSGGFSAALIVAGFFVLKYKLWESIVTYNTKDYKEREKIRKIGSYIIGDTLMIMGAIGVILTGVFLYGYITHQWYALGILGAYNIGIGYMLVASHVLLNKSEKVEKNA